MNEKLPSKADQLRAMREARFGSAKSSSEAKGKPRMPAGSKTGDGLAWNSSRGSTEGRAVGTPMPRRAVERPQPTERKSPELRAGVKSGPREAIKSSRGGGESRPAGDATNSRSPRVGSRTEIGLEAEVALGPREANRKRAKKGTFDRKAYQRDLMRARRQKAKQEAK